MWLEILLLCVLVLAYAIIRDRKPKNCPPGPTEIPFLGTLPVFNEKGAEQLRVRYGNVVMYRTGSIRFVIIFDYKIAKEVLASPDVSNRPTFVSALQVDDMKLGGVVTSNGPHWQHDRRFVLRNLRNLGMGRSYLEEAINIEAKALVEDLKKYNGEAINYPNTFHTAALNIIWQMVASTRYDLRSSEVESVYKISKEFQDNFSALMLLPMMVPVLKYIPKAMRGFLFNEHLLEKFAYETEKVVSAAVEKHLGDHDPDNSRDLIDEYIKDLKESVGDENSLFRRGALNQIVFDLFQAGSETISHALKWTVLFLARYPDYAKRMQEQIDEVVPQGHMVSLDDKARLPLVEAFTTESFRMASELPLNVVRATTKDFTIGEYFVPKDTAIFVGSYYIHHDPRYWDDPHKFYPERFLDESRTKYTAPKEGFFAFGSGRRQCAGELLARMEVFLFTAAIIQNFDVVAPEGVDLTNIETTNVGSIRTPVDLKLMYKPRK